MITDQKHNFWSITIKSVISMIFLLSTIGKLASITETSRSLSELFYVNPDSAQILVLAIALFEVSIILTIWLKPHRLLIAVPVLFFAITAYSQVRNLDCGCFGELPFFSQFPLWGHYLLLTGMLIGFLFLTQNKEGRFNLALLSILLFAFAVTSLFFRKHIDGVNSEIPFATATFAEVNQAITEHNALLIDARSEMQYLYGTIADAINIPEDTNNLDSLLALWNLKEQKLIVFCNGVHCDKAELLSRRLAEAGCEHIYIYSGGWDDWIENEMKLEQ